MSEESVKDSELPDGATPSGPSDRPASRPEAPTPSRPSRPALKPNRVIKLGQSTPPSRPQNEVPKVRTSRPPAPVRSSLSSTAQGVVPLPAAVPRFEGEGERAVIPSPELELDDDAVVTAADSSLPPKVYSSAPPMDGPKRSTTPAQTPGTPPAIKPPPAPPLRSSAPPPASSSDHPARASAPSLTVSYEEEEAPISVEEEAFEAEALRLSSSVPPVNADPIEALSGGSSAGTIAGPSGGSSDTVDASAPVIPKAPALPITRPVEPAIASAKPEAPVPADLGPASPAPNSPASPGAPPPPSLAAKSPPGSPPRRMPIPPAPLSEQEEVASDLEVDFELATDETEELPSGEFEVPAADRKPPPPRRTAKPSLPQAKKPRPKPWWETLFGDDFQRAYRPMSASQITREVDFMVESYKLPRGSVLLDLACGQGEFCIELTRRGYSVVGYDLSVYQLAMAGDNAQQAGQKINFLQGDMREMAFDNMFDGMLCWDTSFGYFEEDKNLEVLKRMKQALKPGGRLLLDILNRDFVGQQAPYSHWFEGDGCVCMDDMNMDWITNRLKVKRSIILDDGRSKEVQYSIRLYSLSDIGRMLHEAGFRVSAVSGGVATRGAFFGPISRRVIIEAIKP